MCAARCRAVAWFAACLSAALVAAPSARAESGRVTLIEENDGLLPDHWDRHYTQGALLTYLSPALAPVGFAPSLFDGVSGVVPVLQPGPAVERRFDVVAGQSIFTPVKYHLAPPDPSDRPFAGWLYTGGSLLQETGGNTLENFELLAGVVGPDSLAQDAQEGFHAAAGFNNRNLDQSWKYQLKDEPGIMLTYERKWKLWRANFGGLETELIPEAGVTAGNVLTYGQGGAMVRIGQDLGADYGVPRVRPSLSGTSWFDPSRMTQPFGWYLFAGVQGRAVAHNIFLDGNTFQNSASVHKEILVGDFTAGASVFWSDWVKLDASFTERTKEFTAQKEMDHFGAASLSVRF